MAVGSDFGWCEEIHSSVLTVGLNRTGGLVAIEHCTIA
jgi:hypothetical protein